MKILGLLAVLSVLCGSVFGQSLDRRALDTNAFYTTIVNAQNPNGGGVDSKYWTNQSGLYRYQPGTGTVVNGQRGPAFTLRGDGSAFVGTNVFQDVSPTAAGTHFPYVVSMTDSNEPTTLHADWWAIDSEAYGVYGGASLTVQQGGSSVLVLSGDTGTPQSIVTLNATPGSDSIKINDNGTDRFVASGSATNVITANAVGQNFLFIGETNGLPSVRMRNLGSTYFGRNVDQDADLNEAQTGPFGTLYSWYTSLTDSNDPARIAIFLDTYDNLTSPTLFSTIDIVTKANKDSGYAYMTMAGKITNGVFVDLRIGADPASAALGNGEIFIASTNNIPVFSVDRQGNLAVINKATYNWPGTNGTAGQVMATGGGSPQQLYWTTASGGAAGTNAVAVAAGTNITAVTNSGLVTVSVTDLTNTINALVTNSINNNARIGPGTNTYLAQFTVGGTNVTNSPISSSVSNVIKYFLPPSGGTHTNSGTNLWYGEFTNAGTNQWVELVVPKGHNNEGAYLRTMAIGQTAQRATLTLNDSLNIEPITNQYSGHGANGLIYPDNDGITPLGTTSKRFHGVNSDTFGFVATPNDSAVIFADGSGGGHGFGISTLGALYFTGPGFAGIQFNSADAGSACLDMKIYPIGFGPTISNVQSTLRWPGIAGLVGIGTNSSVATPTAVGIGASPASGTDKGAPDTILYGGTSTGAGKNGDIRFKTANPAASSSSVNALIDRVLITTNTFTIYSNLVVNGTITSTGFSGSTSNSIFQLFDTPGGIYLTSYGTNSTTYFGTNSADRTTITNGVVLSTQHNYSTNLSTMAPDFKLGYSLITTNAAFTVLAPIGVDATIAQTTVFMVTNSTAAAVAITAPANVHQLGTWYVTNLTSITFFQYGGRFTNAVSLPIF